MTLRNPYASFLEEVEKPARYIGNEKYLVRKNWDECSAKVALCFPDTYEIGMSHLGMKILYEEINKIPTLLAERCFCPWPDMEKKIRDHQLPLVTLENYRPLEDFDLVGFSLQYEMSYSNILTMLDLGGIPLWQNERGESDPFVMVGGPCATHPEPLAPFVDFVVIGDGEKLVGRFAHFVGEARAQGQSREEILRELSTWPGIYVPHLYTTEVDELSGLEVVNGVIDEVKEKTPERVSRFYIESLKDYPFPTQSPIPHMTAIFDRFSVELARGCTEGCRFCQAGMIYRPVRERDPEKVVDMVMEGIQAGGFDEASLTCLSTADYSAVTPLVLDLLDKLVEDKSSLGISSLRAYGLDNKVLDKLASVKNTSLTFAPEAGTERMRKVINKNVSEDDMMTTAKEVFSRGWSKMKLYFMIGLPTETDEDVQGIMETGRKARLVASRDCGVRNPNVTVSVSSFVPKPHTPFQWAPMITLEEIQRKQNLLDDYARKYKLSFRKHFSKISVMEGIVSRGDRRVAHIIYDAWKNGARFDGWNEWFKFDLWMDAVERSGIDPQLMLGQIPLLGRLPWDHIDVGLKDRFLEIEWKKSLKDRLSPPCGKVAGDIVHDSNLEQLEKKFDIDKKKLVCYHCGITCDLKEMVEERREFLTTMKAYKDEPYERPESTGRKPTIGKSQRVDNPGVKYRIEFLKIGSLSFISHLDLQKVLARILKRSGVKVLYSEGYRPKPLISTGPALSLGISSLCEFFDVRVPEAWKDVDQVLKNLNESSETGIVFKSAKLIDRKTKSIQAAIQSSTYYIPVRSNGEGSVDDVEKDVEKKIDYFLNQGSFILSSVHHKTKKVKEKDVRPRVKRLKIGTLNGIESTVMESLSEVIDFSLNKGLELKVSDGVGPADIKRLFEKLEIPIERPIKLSCEVQEG